MSDYKELLNNTFTEGIIVDNPHRESLDFLSDARKQIKQTLIDNYEPNKMLSQNEFNAICLLQLDNTTVGNEELIRVKARIPEVHSLLPLPTKEDDYQKISLYPTFIGNVGDLSVEATSQAIAIGTELSVTFDNTTNFSGPKIVRVQKMSTLTGSANPPNRRNRIKRGRLKRRRGPECSKTGAIGRGIGAIVHPDCTEKKWMYNKDATANAQRYKEIKEGKQDLRLAICNPLKLEDGTTFTHYDCKPTWDAQTERTPNGNPKLQIQHGIADDYVNLLNEVLVKNKLKGRFGSCGGFTNPLQRRKDYCATTSFSWHTLGRAFDMDTLTGMWKHPDNDQMTFLVTLSDSDKQTKDKLETQYAPNFFKRGYSNKSGKHGKNTYTIWFKTKNEIPKNKVTLMVAVPKKKRSSYIFNKDTFVQWTGYAVNFTKIAKRHNFTPINPIYGWKNGKEKTLLPGNKNYNEWHHFTNLKKLEKGITLLKEELWAAGYTEAQLQLEWGENYAFYGEAPYPGPGNSWYVQSKNKMVAGVKESLYTDKTPPAKG